MKLPSRISLLFLLGLFAAGSSALGYYYLFYYEPPLKAAAQFMHDMETRDVHALQQDVAVSSDIEEGKLREPTPQEVGDLVSDGFKRGRILDQRPHEGANGNLYYLVYREPDGRVYALIAAEFGGRYRIVVPETPMTRRHRYLWEYTWSN